MYLRWASFSSVFLRYALALGFLSAVADRFGLWGSFGQPNVAWGSFSRFLEYTHRINWYLPAAGGALLLEHSERVSFSVDNLLFRRRRTGQDTARSVYQRRSPERRIT